MPATRIAPPAVRVESPHGVDVFAYGSTEAAEHAAETFARFGWRVTVGTLDRTGRAWSVLEAIGWSADNA